MDDAMGEWFERVDLRLKCELPLELYERVVEIMLGELKIVFEEENAKLIKKKTQTPGTP